MTKWFQKILICLLIAILIGIPPLFMGYFNLYQAGSTSDRTKASHAYESAANLLFWRPDLYESAGIFANAEPQRAIQLLTNARAHGSLSPSGQVALAEAYFADGQNGPAVDLLQNLLTKNLEMPQVGPILAKYYRGLGLYDEETRVLQRWLENDPLNPQASQELGLILSTQAAPEALPLLQTAGSTQLADLINALETPGEQAYRLILCGQSLAQMNEWKLAEVAFGNAVTSNNVYAEAWAWLGLARQHNGTPGARAAVDNAIKLDGQSASIRVMAGTYYQQNGNQNEAVNQLKTATRLEPANPAWWVALGGAASQTDLSVALNAYIQAVDLAPQQAEYWYDLAAFCMERNAYIDDYGLNAGLQAYALEPKNPLYMDMLGRVQTSTGLFNSAEVMFKKALEASDSTKTNAMIHLHLGLLYLQTNRNDLAKFELEQAVTLDSDGFYGIQAKKLLERYFP